ncbi:hypothetical protein PR048_016195 [Dryococelus australis]|uniref:Tc1-like transposase DDE domain-containing protein n=1 Tax=Dryococelus australis TaxID=614101 RepID=A0ABQ9HJ20_9NEOP|nr:hypothetical protein PR048_016195 [Dryococelus australis]
MGIIQHGNAPCHTPRRVRTWLEVHDQDFEVLPWPPNSPDRNPIEQLWDHLEPPFNSCGTHCRQHGSTYPWRPISTCLIPCQLVLLLSVLRRALLWVLASGHNNPSNFGYVLQSRVEGFRAPPELSRRLPSSYRVSPEDCRVRTESAPKTAELVPSQPRRLPSSYRLTDMLLFACNRAETHRTFETNRGFLSNMSDLAHLNPHFYFTTERDTYRQRQRNNSEHKARNKCHFHLVGCPQQSFGAYVQATSCALAAGWATECNAFVFVIPVAGTAEPDKLRKYFTKMFSLCTGKLAECRRHYKSFEFDHKTSFFDGARGPHTARSWWSTQGSASPPARPFRNQLPPIAGKNYTFHGSSSLDPWTTACSREIPARPPRPRLPAVPPPPPPLPEPRGLTDKTGGEDDNEDRIDDDYDDSDDEVYDEKDDDFFDVPTHFTNEFPSTSGGNKAEGTKNVRNIFPEDPNKPFDRLVGMKRARETGDPLENPPTSGIVRHDSHMRKSGSDPTGIRTRLALPGEVLACLSVMKRGKPSKGGWHARAGLAVLSSIPQTSVTTCSVVCKAMEDAGLLQRHGKVIPSMYITHLFNSVTAVFSQFYIGSDVSHERVTHTDKHKSHSCPTWDSKPEPLALNTQPTAPQEPVNTSTRKLSVGGEMGDPRENSGPAVSSGTILTCENPGVIWPGIEPVSSWWEASKLTTQLRPLFDSNGVDRCGNPTSKVKKRGSNTGDTNTYAQYLIAPMRKACRVSTDLKYCSLYRGEWPTSRGAFGWCAIGLRRGRFWVRIPINPTSEVAAFDWKTRNSAAGNYARMHGHTAAQNRKSCGTHWFLTMNEVSTAGAAVADQLACSPPTKANRVQSPAGSLLMFASRNRARRYGWSAGYLGDLPFPPPLHSGTVPYSPRFILIGSPNQISSLTRSHSMFSADVQSCKHKQMKYLKQLRLENLPGLENGKLIVPLTERDVVECIMYHCCEF